MARRPKANPTAELPELTAPAQAPIVSDPPAGARRGPKPKAATAAKSTKSLGKRAAAAAEEARNEALDIDAPALGASESKADAAPARGGPGRKSKRMEEVPAAPLRQSAKAAKPDKPAKGQRGRKPRDMAVGAVPGPTDASVAVQPASAAASAGKAPHSQTAAQQTAAQWNQATDTAQFDWSEIERIASMQGPNQVMAKLLIAARAEGANSRWPL
jgi:hypothetical protein